MWVFVVLFVLLKMLQKLLNEEDSDVLYKNWFDCYLYLIAINYL